MKISQLFYTPLKKGDKKKYFYMKGKKVKISTTNNLEFGVSFSFMYLASVYPMDRTNT